MSNPFQNKSNSIKDLITFYERTYTKPKSNTICSKLDRQLSAPTYIEATSTTRKLNISLTSSNEQDYSKSSITSSFSSKSSSSVSLNTDSNDSNNNNSSLNMNLIELKENQPIKSIKRTESYTGVKYQQLDMLNSKPTPNSLVQKRKSTSFYISKSSTWVKNAEQQHNSNLNSKINSNVKRFDPKNVQKIVLEWCQNRTKNYPNVNITNFSSSWADGLAFCALIHSYMPDEFDFSKLTSQNRRFNFQLAFDVAYKRANIIPLFEVNDMILMGNRPDDRCIFTYLSTIYSRFNSSKYKSQNLEEIKETIVK